MFKTQSSKITLLVFFFVVLSVLGLYSIKKSEENKKNYYLNVQSELLKSNVS